MKNELKKKESLRLSNEESNRLTKESLQTALITLMATEKFESITISELVKKAGVSRTAFYRNYNSKEEIILEFCDYIIQKINNFLNDDKIINNNFDVLYDYFKTIKKENKYFKILLQAGLYNIYSLNIESITNKILISNSIEERYKSIAINTAIYAITADWVNSGMKETEEFMAKLCENILKKFTTKEH